MKITMIEQDLNAFRMRSEGWVFYYDYDAGFIRATHKNGGHRTIAQVDKDIIGNGRRIAEYYVEILNRGGKLWSPSKKLIVR